MSRMRNLGAVAIIAAGAALFGSGPDRPAAQAAETKFSCLPQDENGKALPNQTVAFVCGQLDALREDCERSVLSGNQAALGLHCFDWTRDEVRSTLKSGRDRAQSSGR